MGLRRKLAKGVGALSVGAVALAFDASAAGAVEDYSHNKNFEHTFTNDAGQRVTCPVSFSSSLFRFSSDEPFFGSGFTGSDIERPECDAFVAVSVSFTDPGGRRESAVADSFQGDVFLGVDDVGSQFVANHFISFLDCSANCEVSGETRPK
jgi:hypothetical protein